jgi:hypothetical protein
MQQGMAVLALQQEAARVRHEIRLTKKQSSQAAVLKVDDASGPVTRRI